MKVKYQQTDPFDSTKYPMLPVTLSVNGSESYVDCLVDSGATVSVFNAGIASELGLDLDTLEKETIEGVGNTKIQSSRAIVKVRVNGFDDWIDLEARFVEDDDMPLLGRSGFFQNYQIIFEEYLGRFEVLSTKQKKRPKKRWR